MNSGPDSTFVVTTDDVQAIVDIAPMVLDDIEYLFADEIEPPQAWIDSPKRLAAMEKMKGLRPFVGDPYPGVSAKCSLEDTAAFLLGDDQDSYSWMDEGWDG
jgi:hypothetical protein